LLKKKGGSDPQKGGIVDFTFGSRRITLLLIRTEKINPLYTLQTGEEKKQQTDKKGGGGQFERGVGEVHDLFLRGRERSLSPKEKQFISTSGEKKHHLWGSEKALEPRKSTPLLKK